MEDESNEFIFEGERFDENEEITESNKSEIEDKEIIDSKDKNTEAGKDEEVDGEEDKETAEEEQEELQKEPKKDKSIQALDSERARRKKAEAKNKELMAEIEKLKNTKVNEEKINSEKEKLKKELMEDEIMEESIADRIVNTLGENLIRQKVANETKEKETSFETEFKEFTKDEMFYDAEDYKDEIKKLMDKGLSMKSAYFALAGEEKMSSIRKDIEVEVEQKLLNNKAKIERTDVGHEEGKDEIKRTRYTKKEQEYANELGMDIKEVHKRLATNTLDGILDL